MLGIAEISGFTLKEVSTCQIMGARKYATIKSAEIGKINCRMSKVFLVGCSRAIDIIFCTNERNVLSCSALRFIFWGGQGAAPHKIFKK